MRDLDVDRSDKTILIVPKQHVGRAEILPEDVELRSTENQYIRDVRAADRDSRRWGVEFVYPRLEQRNH